VEKTTRALGRFLLAASTLGSGCLSLCHPVGQPPSEQVEICKTMPPCCRNHVYIFFVNGLDPLGWANFAGVRDYVHALGFIKTYYGQFYHDGTFAREIRRLHGEDPLARFVVVGFSTGVSRAHALADVLAVDGISIDLLVCISADVSEMNPANVGSLVYILPEGSPGDDPAPGYGISGTVANPSIYGSPTHPGTLETLANELAAVAATVPIVGLGKPTALAAPARTMPAASLDDWDFLKPRPPAGDSPVPPSPHKSPSPPKDPAPLPQSIGRI
jgi:hypothetical protein